MQIDIIPATGSAYYSANIEDGIALPWRRGRSDFATATPNMATDRRARRAFMSDALGIHPKPELLYVRAISRDTFRPSSFHPGARW